MTPDSVSEDESPRDQRDSDTESMSETESDTPDSKFDSERVEVPGRATVHDKRKNPDDVEIDHYACPFCAFTHPTEEGVRGHITHEDDAAHANRNGYLDQIFVHGVDSDGNVVEDLELDSTEKSPEGALSTDLLPDGLTGKQRKILSVAILNPALSNAELAQKVEEETDYSPTASYASRVRDDFLSSPDIEDSDAKSERGYDELTDKQQALIDYVTKFDHPTDPSTWPETRTEVGQAAGYSGGSDIPNLIDRYGHIAQHRKARREAQEERNGPSRASETETNEDTPVAEETHEEPATASTEDSYTIDQSTLSKFATRIDQIQADAEKQADLAPDDSLMAGHAAGKSEVVETVERFLRTVREDNDGGNDE